MKWWNPLQSGFRSRNNWKNKCRWRPPWWFSCLSVPLFQLQITQRFRIWCFFFYIKWLWIAFLQYAHRGFWNFWWEGVPRKNCVSVNAPFVYRSSLGIFRRLTKFWVFLRFCLHSNRIFCLRQSRKVFIWTDCLLSMLCFDLARHQVWSTVFRGSSSFAGHLLFGPDWNWCPPILEHVGKFSRAGILKLQAWRLRIWILFSIFFLQWFLTLLKLEGVVLGGEPLTLKGGWEGPHHPFLFFNRGTAGRRFHVFS